MAKRFSDAEIDAAIASIVAEYAKSPTKRKRNRKSLKGSYMIDSNMQRVPLKPSVIGRFEGKAGSVRRSRKGRTYRAPNGSRTYVGDMHSSIIAYKANPS